MSAVFEHWCVSPQAAASKAAAAAAVGCTHAAAAHNTGCPVLALLLRCENLRGLIFDQASIGALHRLCRVCSLLREWSTAYMREAVPRPVVFGGTRGGRWRSTDGSSVSDACCAEELRWGASLAWLPVPSLYSRLRLDPPATSAEAPSIAA